MTELSATEAYNYSADTYNRYAQAKRAGKSDAEAVGEVGGAIAGAAACTATGAGIAVAGICGTLGGILGGVVGGALNDLFGSKPDQADAVCTAVWKRLEAMINAAAEHGVTITRAQAQQWFADAATRAQLAQTHPGTTIRGEIGRAGAVVTLGGGVPFPEGTTFTLNAAGVPTVPLRERGPVDRFGNPTSVLTLAGRYPMIALFSPVGRCIYGGMRLTTVGGDVSRSVAIGLTAVAARIDSLGSTPIIARSTRAVLQDGDSAGKLVTYALLGGGLVAGARWLWRRYAGNR